MVLRGLLVLLAVAVSSAGASASADPKPVNVGSLNVLIRNLTIVTSYVRDAKTGAYMHQKETVSSFQEARISTTDMVQKTSGAITVTNEIGAKDCMTAQISRQAEAAELQIYSAGCADFSADQSRQPATVQITKLNLKLISGTWKDFENGKEVQAEIVDANDSQELVKNFTELAEDYYQSTHKLSVEKATASEEPTIRLEKIRATRVSLSSNRIVVTQQVDTVKIDAELTQFIDSRAR